MPFHPHKMETDFDETNMELLAGGPAVINEFLHVVKAVPFIPQEKAENDKPVAFKKMKTERIRSSKETAYSNLKFS